MSDYDLSEEWRKSAKCKIVGKSADFFHPTGKNKEIEEERAASFCRGMDGSDECPVRIACLEWAINNKQEDGVWGGYTEKGRKRLVRVRRKMRAKEQILAS